MEDLKEIDGISYLNNTEILGTFICQLRMVHYRHWYNKQSLKLQGEGKSEFKIVTTFMVEERVWHRV